MTDFFIGYTSTDETWAEWIAWVLEEANFSVVLQKWDFRPGANFVLETQRAAAAPLDSHPLPKRNKKSKTALFPSNRFRSLPFKPAETPARETPRRRM